MLAHDTPLTPAFRIGSPRLTYELNSLRRGLTAAPISARRALRLLTPAHTAANIGLSPLIFHCKVTTKARNAQPPIDAVMYQTAV